MGNHGFFIFNTADVETELLTVKDDAGTTIDIIYPGRSNWFISDSSTWEPAYDFTNVPDQIRPNALINGGFRVAQRGTSFTAATSPLNSDDTYLLDRWVLLSEGNDIVDVSQSAVVPDGAKASIKLEVETANKQFGILQILENKDAMAFAGKQASLSFQAKMAAADDNTHSLKAVVLSWDSTADTVTSDVVDVWSASPSFVANWTAENTPASITLTTEWHTFEITNISIDTASMANLAVFIYCDQTDGAADDAIYITGVKLEVGETATDFVARPYAEELALCQRYFERIQQVDYGVYYVGFVATTTVMRLAFGYVEKRTIPTVSISDVSKFELMYQASAIATTDLEAFVMSLKNCRLDATVGAAVLTVGDACLLRGNNTTLHFIDISAEL